MLFRSYYFFFIFLLCLLRVGLRFYFMFSLYLLFYVLLYLLYLLRSKNPSPIDWPTLKPSLYGPIATSRAWSRTSPSSHLHGTMHTRLFTAASPCSTNALSPFLSPSHVSHLQKRHVSSPLPQVAYKSQTRLPQTHLYSLQ